MKNAMLLAMSALATTLMVGICPSTAKAQMELAKIESLKSEAMRVATKFPSELKNLEVRTAGLVKTDAGASAALAADWFKLQGSLNFIARAEDELVAQYNDYATLAAFQARGGNYRRLEDRSHYSFDRGKYYFVAPGENFSREIDAVTAKTVLDLQIQVTAKVLSDLQKSKRELATVARLAFKSVGLMHRYHVPSQTTMISQIGYTRYVEIFPNGPHGEEALYAHFFEPWNARLHEVSGQTKLKELRAYLQRQQEFLKRYPTGANAEKVREFMEQVIAPALNSGRGFLFED